jgi:hypothetical protein
VNIIFEFFNFSLLLFQSCRQLPLLENQTFLSHS